VFPTITGDGKDAPPSNEDIARVVVAVLMDPDKHAGKVYRPTGPALLSGNDMAAVLSRVLSRKVRRVDLPWRLFLKAARTANVCAWRVFCRNPACHLLHRSEGFHQSRMAS